MSAPAEVLAALLREAIEDEQFPGINFDSDEPAVCRWCGKEQPNLNLRAPEHWDGCFLNRARAALGGPS